mmetsp:Transcript_43904/g.70237  ORF Transcript_43904/g.70237 Transcript_43904/m.70237 type:complete len:83 (-) Transcript_43904:160-408(-)
MLGPFVPPKPQICVFLWKQSSPKVRHLAESFITDAFYVKIFLSAITWVRFRSVPTWPQTMQCPGFKRLAETWRPLHIEGEVV